MSFKLCYINSPWVWFTTLEDVRQQWGDDWDDKHYEHNAGDPYEWKEYMLKDNIPPYKLLRIAINNCYFVAPCDNYSNSPYSVKDINEGIVSWLRKDDKGCSFGIYAGTTLGDFCKIIKDEGGEVYFPIFQKWSE